MSEENIDLTLNPILYVRTSNNDICPINVIRGTSAYEYAKAAGYTGTALDLGRALSAVSGNFVWDWEEGTSLGPKGHANFGSMTYSIPSIPEASVNRSGIITTISQSFAGEKTFFNTLNLSQADDAIKNGVFLYFKPKYTNSSGTISSNGGCYLCAYDDGDTAGNGCNLLINSGAATLVGGGESSKNFYTYFWSKPANKEELFLLSDVNINFYTFCGENFDNDKKVFKKDPVNILTLSGTAGYPGENNSYTWGTSSNKWKEIYTTDLKTTTISASGASTLKALSAATGTFSSTLDVSGATTIKNLIWVKNSSDEKKIGHLGVGNSKNTEGKSRNALYMGISYDEDTKAYSRIILTAGSGSTLCPYYVTLDYVEATSKISLGTEDRPWEQVFASDTSINTSDIRLKNVQSEDHLYKLLKMYDEVTPIAYKRKNLSKYDDYKRIHVGLSAQDVEEKMLCNGLTSLDFAGLCFDNIDPNIPDYQNVLLDNKKYSLRYGEFHGLHILKNHQQDSRLTELEKKNQQLENTIAELKTQIELLKLAIGG